MTAESEVESQVSLKERLARYVTSSGEGRDPLASDRVGLRAVPRHRLVDRFFVANEEISSQSGYHEIVSPNNPDPSI